MGGGHILPESSHFLGGGGAGAKEKKELMSSFRFQNHKGEKGPKRLKM